MCNSFSNAITPENSQQPCKTRVILLSTCHGSRSGTKCRACFPAMATSVGSRAEGSAEEDDEAPPNDAGALAECVRASGAPGPLSNSVFCSRSRSLQVLDEDEDEVEAVAGFLGKNIDSKFGKLSFAAMAVSIIRLRAGMLCAVCCCCAKCCCCSARWRVWAAPFCRSRACSCCCRVAECRSRMMRASRSRLASFSRSSMIVDTACSVSTSAPGRSLVTASPYKV
mmetsp:Transcript_33303/g.88505  ORF Transcript_33303/g.88505 Transcript_33303/m.88505 type:complete len:225 (-) Transcript_33303:62-736(-)